MSKSFSTRLQKASSFVADIFFPQSCFGCGASFTWLCAHCQARIPTLLTQHCLQCSKNITRYGERCFECKETHPLDALFTATCYQVPIIKRMIHAYKYQFVESLALPLGELLAKSVEKSALPLPHLLAPVPLHPKRLRFRGFNQSFLLAQSLSRQVSALTDITIATSLLRVRMTKPQQQTSSKEERLENSKGAFAIKDGVSFDQKIVWLIDDVATTQSTLTECARVLKEAGAKKVYAVVLAKD